MRLTRSVLLLLAVAMTVGAPTYLEAEKYTDHSAWDGLLHRYVRAGFVDYEGMQRERDVLDRYLASRNEVSRLQIVPHEMELADWINTYNACVVKGVLDHYPLKSVKDVKGFFDHIRYRVNGEPPLTLNDIERRGRMLRDWRMHFAVVCASSSCPPLRSEAYVPERLNDQLAEQARQFLNDPQKGLRLEPRQETLWVSKIFQWYTKDFIPDGHLSAEKLLEVLRPVLDPAIAQAIGQELLKDYQLHVKFLDYDWSLNERHEP